MASQVDEQIKLVQIDKPTICVCLNLNKNDVNITEPPRGKTNNVVSEQA